MTSIPSQSLETTIGQNTAHLDASAGTFSRKKVSWVPLGVPVALFALGAIALFADVPLARFFSSTHCPGTLREILENAESFGHAVGVISIALAMYLVIPAKRIIPVLILVCSLGSGMMANIIKLLVGRARPRHFDLVGQGVWDTFQQGFPLLGGGSGLQSFPSAHTATAFGLAVILTHLYPRAWSLFFTLALLVGANRMVCGAHFLSDVLVGAAVGWLFATAIIKKSSGRLPKTALGNVS